MAVTAAQARKEPGRVDFKQGTKGQAIGRSKTHFKTSLCERAVTHGLVDWNYNLVGPHHIQPAARR
jgi:hypothetical protein